MPDRGRTNAADCAGTHGNWPCHRLPPGADQTIEAPMKVRKTSNRVPMPRNGGSSDRVRCPSPVDDLGRRGARIDLRPDRLRTPREPSWPDVADLERPPRLRTAVARWPRGALLGTSGDRRHDGRDDARTPSRARSGAVSEGAGCDRPALGRQTRRRRRSWLFRARLSGGRDRMGGAVAQVRGGRPSASGAPATSGRTVRRNVLLDGGDASAPRPNPTRRTTHLDGKLGVGRRLATRGAPRRRVVGLRLQHDPRSLRRDTPTPARASATGGDRHGGVPQRDRDDVPLPDRGCGGRRRCADRRYSRLRSVAHPSSSENGCSWALPASVSTSSLGSSPQVPSVFSSGRSATSSISSKGSTTPSCRGSALDELVELGTPGHVLRRSSKGGGAEA